MKTTFKEVYIFTMIGLTLLAAMGAMVWGVYSEYQKYQYRKAVIELAQRRK